MRNETAEHPILEFQVQFKAWVNSRPGLRLQSVYNFTKSTAKRVCHMTWVNSEVYCLPLFESLGAVLTGLIGRGLRDPSDDRGRNLVSYQLHTLKREKPNL